MNVESSKLEHVESSGLAICEMIKKISELAISGGTQLCIKGRVHLIHCIITFISLN
jgi:hypothetical protein